VAKFREFFVPIRALNCFEEIGMRVTQLLVIVMAGLLLAGCPKKPETIPEGQTAEPAEGADTEGSLDSDVSGGAMGADQAALQEAQRAGTIVYFDYDRAEIKAEFVGVVAAHAKFLNGGSGRRVRLEGHSDERGSREYNIGLGERRAQAVRRALMLQGVTEAQITTVSYGEERPAVQGGDESAYGKNRRVELVYGR
jgi:peptidoglycan-associated lipoprotein